MPCTGPASLPDQGLQRPEHGHDGCEGDKHPEDREDEADYDVDDQCGDGNQDEAGGRFPKNRRPGGLRLKLTSHITSVAPRGPRGRFLSVQLAVFRSCADAAAP